MIKIEVKIIAFSITIFICLFLVSPLVLAEAARGEAQAVNTLPATVSSPSNCLTSTCNEIDEVWTSISMVVGGPGAGKIWDGSAWVEKKVVPPPVAYPFSLPIGTTTCLNLASSSTEAEAQSKLVTVTLQGKSIRVNKIVAPLINKIDREINALNTGYTFNRVLGYDWRCVKSPIVSVNDPEACVDPSGKVHRSKHSYGTAIDINPETNGFYVNGGPHDIPQSIINVFKANDFKWGGDWSRAQDYMHFDWSGHVGDFNGDSQLEACGGASVSGTGGSTITGSSFSSVPYGVKSCTYIEVNQYITNNPSPSTLSGWKNAVENIGLRGNTWMGKIASNGGNDNVYREDLGRDTIIFVPCSTDFSKPVELMYFFHGLGGFYGLSDMIDRVAPESKILSQQGRNFVIIFPEMSYSKGTDAKRSTSGRSALMWDGSDSNLKQFHEDLVNIIKTNFAQNLNIGYVSMTGHSMGGSALSRAALLPTPSNSYLQQIRPNKIVFSDAGYGAGASQYKNVFNNYIKNNPSAQMFMIVQHPSLNSAHEPTANAINLVKELGGSATSSWNVDCPLQGNYCRVASYNTPGAEGEITFVIPGYPNLFYVPIKQGHLEIGKMSLAWLPTAVS